MSKQVEIGKNDQEKISGSFPIFMNDAISVYQYEKIVLFLYNIYHIKNFNTEERQKIFPVIWNFIHTAREFTNSICIASYFDMHLYVSYF